MPTLAQARAAALRAHPAAPLVTDCTQGRVELSHVTFDNWVTKTVNFLQMEADLTPGATVALRLPLHWMTAVWWVSVWEAGADACFDADGTDLVVADGGPCDVYVVADPLGMAPPPPDASADWYFPPDVRGMPDRPVLPRGEPGGLRDVGDAAAVFDRAVEYAGSRGLSAGGRLATQVPVTSPDGVLAAIAAPLAVGAAVVYGPADQEMVTASA